MREPRTRAFLSLECRRGLARTKVQWNGKHAIPCSAWCRVTVRGCVMFLGYWLNDLGLHDKSLNPCRLSACWQRDVSSTCLHIDLRTLRVWRVRIPKVSPPGPRNNLSVTLPVFHALLAMGLAAIETFHWTCASFFLQIQLWITCPWLSTHSAFATWMTWLRIQPYVQHIIHCHSGLKSWGTE